MTPNTARSLFPHFWQAEYEELKNVVILMIVPYDPFGLGRMVYTNENGCKEAPEMPYDDGAKTLFLYTKGTVGVPNEEVKQLLRYMEETTLENAGNDDLREIHEMVEIPYHIPPHTSSHLAHRT